MASMSINGVLQGSYRYDFAGRQAIRTIAATGITIHSVFDAQGRRIAEYNQATGALIREYVWMGWEPVAVIEGGVVSFIRTDHIGRPVFATNPTGVKTWTATYDPFGAVRTTVGTPIPARFPGQWFQTESGLHQNWMRDYDPTTGRYLQADPLGLVDGASVYGYAGQSPMANTDPTGECFGPLAAACVGAVVGVVTGYVIDQIWGDGCYTWQEAGRDAALGAAFGALGGVYGGAAGKAGGGVFGGTADDIAKGFGGIGDDLLGRIGPGPFAGKSIPARSPARDFTSAERAAIDDIGVCHTCGTTQPGTKTGHFVPDHQPSTALNPPGGPQQLFPHCLGCSRQQGLDIANYLKNKNGVP